MCGFCFVLLCLFVLNIYIYILYVIYSIMGLKTGTVMVLKWRFH